MSSDLRRILDSVERGEARTTDELLPLVYAELRALASRRLARERPGTLQATALVHEAWLRLAGDADGTGPRWQGVAHFYAAAAESIRRILVERARARGTSKRGGDVARVPLDAESVIEHALADGSDLDLVLDLDEALVELGRLDERKARLVELRYFAGLSLEEAAESLSISPATADRDWAYARAWLRDRLDRDRGRGGESRNP